MPNRTPTSGVPLGGASGPPAADRPAEIVRIPFTFPDTGQPVRTVTIDGEPWFVAADVCGVLEIANVSQAVSYLDDDEKKQVNPNLITNEVGGRDPWIVSEPGLYSLILRSRKPQAKPFKRWITHEVIPSIRRTGRYDVAALDDPLAEIERQTQLTAQAVAIARQERAARETAEHKAAELAPLAEAWEQFANARGLIHPAVFAQQSGVIRPGGKPLGQNSALRALRALRILKDAPGTDRHNTPYQAHAHRIKTVSEPLGGALRNVPYIWPRHAHYLRARILGHLYPAPAGATVLYLPTGEGRAR